MGLIDKLKFAFSTGSEQEFAPTEEQKEVVDLVTSEVVKRRMTGPALLFLEMSRPLNFIGAQAMHFLQPIISAVLTSDKYDQFAKFLEHRKSIDYMTERIEYFENEKEMKGKKSDKEIKPEIPVKDEKSE